MDLALKIVNYPKLWTKVVRTWSLTFLMPFSTYFQSTFRNDHNLDRKKSKRISKLKFWNKFWWRQKRFDMKVIFGIKLLSLNFSIFPILCGWYLVDAALWLMQSGLEVNSKCYRVWPINCIHACAYFTMTKSWWIFGQWPLKFYCFFFIGLNNNKRNEVDTIQLIPAQIYIF